MAGWIGVDLDGTLAEYDEWRGIEHIGAPIPAMIERVKRWLDEGRSVKVFTARVSHAEERAAVTEAIDAWCQEHIGIILPVTNVKDFGMDELWDDRAVGVQPNTGRQLSPSRRGLDSGGETLSAQAEGYRRIVMEILNGNADRDPAAFLQSAKIISQQQAEKGA